MIFYILNKKNYIIMSVQNDKEVSKSFIDDLEILPENHEAHGISFKILL